MTGPLKTSKVNGVACDFLQILHHKQTRGTFRAGKYLWSWIDLI